jgi:hypothetical protein
MKRIKKPAPLTVRASYQTYMETHVNETVMARIVFKETCIRIRTERPVQAHANVRAPACCETPGASKTPQCYLDFLRARALIESCFCKELRFTA